MNKKYLIDANVISSQDLLNHIDEYRENLYVIDQVIDELKSSGNIIDKIRKLRIKELEINADHIEMLPEVLKLVGNNFNLINISKNEGSADILMIAYVLSEKKPKFGQQKTLSDELFKSSFVIVTNDKVFSSVAKQFDIENINLEDFKKILISK